MYNSKNLAVVSGGTKGIGKAIIKKFMSQGWAIATCSRNESELISLQEEFAIYGKSKLYVKRADLSKKQEVEQYISFVQSIGCPITVLINNAGRFVPGILHEQADGLMEEMIETNLYSAYRLTKGFISEMKERKKGHIFNISSVAGISTYPNGGAYSVSKFAMRGFSKSLREELKLFGIKVTTVLPGAVLTPSWAGTTLPENRFIDPEDIAESIYSIYQLSPRTVVEEILLRPQAGDI